MANYCSYSRNYDCSKKGIEIGSSGGGLGLLTLASLGAGAALGFCHAQGITIEKQTLEDMLTYGPAIVQGAGGALTGGIIGGMFGIEAFARLIENSRLPVFKKVATAACVAGIGAVSLGGLGGVIGAALGALETVVGYGAGYAVGYILR